MAQRFYQDPGAFGVGYPVIGNTSVQFSVGDPVYINTSGYLAICTNAVKVLGYSLDNVTMSATNTSVAKVCPKYVVSEAVKMVYPIVGSAAVDQTDVGEYVVLSSTTTGAISLAATNSGTVGQFLIVGFDPSGDGTTYDAVVQAAFRQPRVIAYT